jgi:signal peptidase I
MILGVIILAVIAASGFFITQGINHVGITLDTNGTDVTVRTFSLISFPPSDMETEIKDKVLYDIKDPNSNVNSIKNDVKAVAKKYNYNVDVTVISQFGTDQLPMPATVRGDSMYPTLKDGQGIVLLKTNNLKEGDIVVAFHPDYGMIVKRLAKIQGYQVYLKSDNRNVEVISTQTHLYGNVYQVETIKKTPLDTWLPKSNVIGVVKIY